MKKSKTCSKPPSSCGLATISYRISSDVMGTNRDLDPGAMSYDDRPGVLPWLPVDSLRIHGAGIFTYIHWDYLENYILGSMDW